MPVLQDWIRRYHPAPSAGARLVCFPHAGGSASYYRPLSAQLVSRLDTAVVQYPGRQDRRGEPPVTDIAVLAEHVATALSADPDDRPLALFGHSMGALAAYEVALRLQRPPVALVVSGKRAPSTAVPETVHLLDDAGILAGLRGLSGTDAVLFSEPELQAMALPALRADYAALGAYRWTPRPSPACPITVLGGDRDPLAPVPELAEWGGHTSAGLTMEIFPGGHFYLTDHLPAVASAIIRAVERAIGAR